MRVRVCTKYKVHLLLYFVLQYVITRDMSIYDARELQPVAVFLQMAVAMTSNVPVYWNFGQPLCNYY